MPTFRSFERRFLNITCCIYYLFFCFGKAWKNAKMKYDFTILTHPDWYYSPTIQLQKSKTGISCMDYSIPLAIFNIAKIHILNCGMWDVAQLYEEIFLHAAFAYSFAV